MATEYYYNILEVCVYNHMSDITLSRHIAATSVWDLQIIFQQHEVLLFTRIKYGYFF